MAEEYNVEKIERKGKQNHLFYNIEAVRKNIKWGKGKRTEISEGKSIKKWERGRISSCKKLYTHLLTLFASKIGCNGCLLQGYIFSPPFWGPFFLIIAVSLIFLFYRGQIIFSVLAKVKNVKKTSVPLKKP